MEVRPSATLGSATYSLPEQLLGKPHCLLPAAGLLDPEGAGETRASVVLLMSGLWALELWGH